MKKLKTITSYTGLYRWLAEIPEDPVSYAPRCVTAAIPSPYRYSPSVAVYLWNGKQVVYFEVSHRRYEVFEAPTLTFATDAEATEYHIKSIVLNKPR